MRFDTISALISGSPPAAVAWVRISGDEAYEVASKLFSPWPNNATPRHALYGRFAHGDDGLALPFAEGKSYTGERVVEFSVHGSRASITALLDACERAGARPARPGEFTLRAFLNGRIDLTQAEAVAETVDALTERQLRMANLNREGALARQVREVRESLLDLLARIEASVDFPDEVGDLDLDAAASTCAYAAQNLNRLIDEGKRAHLARQGLRVAILGRPNAGKSSLLNVIVGSNRAIVTEIPGTTRDTVEETVSFGGVPIVLIDTAGIRQTEDIVEQIGVQRTFASAETADRLWYLFDASTGWTAEDEIAISALQREAMLIGNKSDIATPERGIPVSAVTGQGIGNLLELTVADLVTESETPATNDRQSAALSTALESVLACQDAANAHHPPDLLTVFLRDAIETLGRVTGETATPDMLQEIFSRFCIGK
ncbi:MAG TPA: tRNA uridine-5-carboxymethylaminomethyl(34) synthesis GTPase MnmE [Fimbriimonas sp.]|nr:tRNA uridine-5-carboxymethylaminomethyl(34) synthesis GTPase MnmE [Fimbriimonas sp.]